MVLFSPKSTNRWIQHPTFGLQTIGFDAESRNHFLRESAAVIPPATSPTAVKAIHTPITPSLYKSVDKKE